MFDVSRRCRRGGFSSLIQHRLIRPAGDGPLGAVDYLGPQRREHTPREAGWTGTKWIALAARGEMGRSRYGEFTHFAPLRRLLPRTLALYATFLASRLLLHDLPFNFTADWSRGNVPVPSVTILVAIL